MAKLTERAEWQALQAHKKQIAWQQMQDWFKEDPQRFTRYSLKTGEILFDYSKNRITTETLPLLCKLAQAVGLNEKTQDLFAGNKINFSEQRPALHTALRAPSTSTLFINGKNILPAIHLTLKKMLEFTEKVRTKIWRGANGKPIRDIVNIGVGGSHLGPLLTVSALADYVQADLHCHFISNIDDAQLTALFKKIDPAATLFIISSKSFTTLETITNAKTLRSWLQNQLGITDVSQHFIAITAAHKKALQFGIPRKNIFTLWEWVGGRYSVWSAIGLPLALLIGMDKFLEFLAGAHAIDQHFLHSEFSQNIPVIMGLLSVWYINFFNANHHAIIPYSHHLHYLHLYIQQLEMESNGKSMMQSGEAVNFMTAPVILGGQGCNGQHAFHQLMHQGTHFIPADFILVGKENNELSLHQAILIASGLSQAQALMRGKSYDEALAELSTIDCPAKEHELLAKQLAVPGNRPSSLLLLDRLTPYNLGALLAIYEHKTFVQSAIWNINCFDQWGVELGKQLLVQILAELTSSEQENNTLHDSSTQGIIRYYKALRKN